MIFTTTKDAWVAKCGSKVGSGGRRKTPASQDKFSNLELDEMGKGCTPIQPRSKLFLTRDMKGI